MHNYAPEIEIALTRKQKIILFARFFNHVWGACSVLYELIIGQEPPKLKEIIKMTGRS